MPSRLTESLLLIPHAPVASEICLQCTKSEGGKLCFGPHTVQSANSYCTNLEDPGNFGGPEGAGAIRSRYISSRGYPVHDGSLAQRLGSALPTRQPGRVTPAPLDLRLPIPKHVHQAERPQLSADGGALRISADVQHGHERRPLRGKVKL